MALMKQMLTNKILTGLPDADFARLLPLLTPVSLLAGERLSEAGESPRHVYFPEDSILSCQACTEDGRTAELSMVGFEGAAGITAFLNRCHQAVHSLSVCVGGSALRLSAHDVKLVLPGSDGVASSLLAYTSDYVRQVEQRAACAMLHALQQRFAVWLLLLVDRLRTNTIEITQERISRCLGSRRAGISVMAAQMQEAGAISFRRGHLRIVDRLKLEAMACECYQTLAMDKQPTYM